MTGPASAQTRLALVIGNNAYRHVAALASPLNDAQDMAETLGRLGFDVRTLTDATFDDMRRASTGARARPSSSSYSSQGTALR